MTEWAEVIYVLMMVSGVGLFALGGTEIPSTGRGYKWLRRFVYPIVIFLLLWWLFGEITYKIIGCCLTLSFVLHLGYSYRKKLVTTAFTAVSYGFPSLWFGPTMWLYITPIAFLTMYTISQKGKEFELDFPWKIVEGITGMLITATIIASLHRPWR